jgi:hypothetical protein
VVPESVSPYFRRPFSASQSIKHPFFVGHPSYLKVRFAAQAPDAQNQKSPSHKPPLERRSPPLLTSTTISFSPTFSFVTVVDSVRPLVQFSPNNNTCSAFVNYPASPCSIDFEFNSNIFYSPSEFSPDSVSRLTRTRFQHPINEWTFLS